MRKDTYHFIPLKIYRIEGTSLAMSAEVQDKIGTAVKSTILRFYEVNHEEQIYTSIGIRAVSMPLYTSLRSDYKALSEVINKFIDLHPKYEHLLRH